MADPEIEQLKALVRQNIALSQENSRMLHGMRRTARLKSLFWFLIFCLSIGSSIYTYYYFIEPRVNQIKEVYQKDISPLQGASSAIAGFIKSLGTTTPQTGQ